MDVVAFSGTRDLDTSPGSKAFRVLQNEILELPAGTTVIHGNSGNVDLAVDRLARERGDLTVKPFDADWKRHGKAAGPIRNSEMAHARPSRWVIIWDGHSRGSADALRKAKLCGSAITQYLVMKGDPRDGAPGALW